MIKDPGEYLRWTRLYAEETKVKDSWNSDSFFFPGTDKQGFGFGGTGKKSFGRQFDSYGEVKCDDHSRRHCHNVKIHF